MDNNFENNLKYFYAKYTIEGEMYKKKLEQGIDESSIIIEQDRKGNTIFAVNVNNHKWYLDSRYDSRQLAGHWTKEYKDSNYAAIFCVFGLGNGDKISAMLKELPSTCNVLIFEPSLEIFHCAMKYCDITKIIADDRVYICVNQLQDTLLMDALSAIMDYGRVNHTKIMSLPNYDKIFKEEIQVFLKDINDVYSSKMITSNTARSLGKEMNEQFFKNVFFMLHTSSIDVARENILKKHYDKYPAILVAGGPSLDGNVDELRRAVGKCFIFCVDTAIRALLRRDIIPDAIITIDSHKPLELFEDERVKDIPMVACYQTRYEIIKDHRAKVFMYSNNDYVKSMYKKYGREVRTLQTAGSVANSGFAFIEEIGIKNIILIGQDCAFTGNKLHTADGYRENAFEVTEKMFLVEGNDGEMVYTDLVYDGYKKFFEKEIRRNHDLNVINATEGGAKIAGTQIMTLSEAIDQYCTEKVDFKEAFNQMENSFTGEKYEALKAELYALPDSLDNLDKTLSVYIKKYKQMEKKAIKKNVKKQELEAFLKDVESFNDIVVNDPLMSIVILHASVTEHEVLEDVNDYAKDMYKDILDICSRGIKVIEAYRKEIIVLKKEAEQAIG